MDRESAAGSPAISFGPVPSRRLGQSLGVNHLPFEVCSYSCRYCQVGPVQRLRLCRQAFYPTARVVEAVMRRVDECRSSNDPIDYITFVPDGEPTLDAHLGEHIRGLSRAGIPVAVLTNGSLLWMPQVRDDLAAADLVSVKVDTTDADIWHRQNRPHGELELGQVLEGVATFAREYQGTLISETMLVGSLNDTEESVVGTASFLAGIRPACAYLGVPTRPPAERDVAPPSNLALVRAYEVMSTRLERVELLPFYDAGEFRPKGDPIEGLLAILAVHPMRETAVVTYMNDAGVGAAGLETLVRAGRVERVEYHGERFMTRCVR